MAKEYIEREAAKRAIMWCEDENNFDFSQGLIAAEDTLDNIPAADVVPVRHGRWQNPVDAECYQCSVCGKYRNQECGLNAPFFDRFCPNCGARMDMVTDCNHVKDGDGE